MLTKSNLHPVEEVQNPNFDQGSSGGKENYDFKSSLASKYALQKTMANTNSLNETNQAREAPRLEDSAPW